MLCLLRFTRISISSISEVKVPTEYDVNCVEHPTIAIQSDQFPCPTRMTLGVTNHKTDTCVIQGVQDQYCFMHIGHSEAIKAHYNLESMGIFWIVDKIEIRLYETRRDPTRCAGIQMVLTDL